MDVSILLFEVCLIVCRSWLSMFIRGWLLIMFVSVLVWVVGGW